MDTEQPQNHEVSHIQTTDHINNIVLVWPNKPSPSYLFTWVKIDLMLLSTGKCMTREDYTMVRQPRKQYKSFKMVVFLVTFIVTIGPDRIQIEPH